MLDKASFALVHYAVLAVLVVSSYVIGGVLARRVKFQSQLESGVFRIALGLGLLACIIFVLGLFHALYGWLIRALLAACLLLAIPSISRAIRALDWQRFVQAARRPKIGAEAAIVGVILAGLLMQAFLMPLYPPTQWDATSYHFAAAKIYASSHLIAPTPYLRFAVAPQVPEMLSTLALLLYDDITAQLISLVMMLLCAAALYSWGRRAFSAKTGLFAAMVLLSCPLVLFLGSSGYIDMALALFTTLAVYALLNWKTSGQASWLTISAVFVGLAAGSKYSALFFVPALCTCIFILAERPRRSGLIAKFLFVSCLVCVPWYIRNYICTGNPVFPFCSSLFPQAIWNAGDLHAQMREMSSYGTGKSLVSLALLPWHLTFRQQLFQNGGLLAPFMIFTPLILGFFVFRSYATTIAAVALGYVLFWFTSVQVLRYLMPVVPLLILLTSYILLEWPMPNLRPRLRGTLARLGTIAMITVALPGLAQVSHQALKRGVYPTGQSQRYHYLAKQVPGFSAIAFLNTTCGSNYTVYALYGEPLAYYADGGFRGDWFGPARYSDMEKSASTSESLARFLRKQGATHLALVTGSKKFIIPDDQGFRSRFERVFADSSVTLYRLQTNSP